MATLEIIKQRIVALSSGKFQNLCDAYLNENGYKNIVSHGSKPGTEKTTKGTPDTYCLDSDGKYIFIEYTTQQEKLYDKIQDDLEKCFDDTKTKIPVADISSIFYFHTTSNLTPGQDSFLKQYCSKKGVELYIIGIDMLANELFNKHKFLAKEYLGTSISTEQILTQSEFISKYNNSPTAASINTYFMFREAELAKIDSAFSVCNIVLLSGAAGVGKTRLAIEYAENYSASNKATFYCIRNNNLPIYDDLHLFFDKEDNYIVLIDDANELGNLKTIIEFFRDRPFNNKIKILITVRNYALTTVKNDISPLETYREVVVNIFSDEEIEEFLKKEFDIQNYEYINRITKISEGNARIAFLTGKIACEKNSLSSINDVSSAYSAYYGQYLQKNSILDRKILISAGIAAFVNAINLDYIDNIRPILEISEITETEFKNALYMLHEHEIIDIYKDKAVKFSDQCLSNYLLKYIFFDKKLISLSRIIKCYFTTNKSRTIDSVNTILNYFINDDVHQYVISEIRKLWNELEKEQSPIFEEFVKSFYIANPTAALILLSEKIDNKDASIISADEIDVNKNKNNQSIRDDILKVLGGFSNTAELSDALDLYFRYYLKCPDLYDQFYHTANLYYGINKDYYRYGCYTTITFLEKINEYSDNWSNEYITLLFIEIASEFLNFSFNNIKTVKNNKISHIVFRLQDSNSVRKYRSLIWNYLLVLAEKENSIPKIEKILLSYGNGVDKTNRSIVEFESEYLIKLLERFYKYSELKTCFLCVHLQKIFDYANINYGKFFDQFFSNAEFQMYMVLKGPEYDINIKYNEYHENKKRTIALYIQQCDEAQFKKLIDMCTSIYASIDNVWNLGEGLRTAFDIIFETKEYFAEAVQYYLQSNTPGDFLSPIHILSQLFEKLDDKKVWDLICCCDYQNINSWQYAYFHELPDSYIDSIHTEELFAFLKNDSDKQILSSLYRDVSFLHKYEKINSNSFIDGCKIIFSKKEYSNYIVYIYFDLLFNAHANQPQEVIKLFHENYQLLEDVYLLLICYDKNTDYDGKFLKEFYTVNSNILTKYLNEKENKLSGEDMDRIRCLLKLNNYIETIDFVMENLIEKAEDNFYHNLYLLEAFLAGTQNETVIQENQDKWLEHYIKENCANLMGMKTIFFVIANYSDDRKIKYIKKFLEHNMDYDFFAQLPLLPSSSIWSESKIPLLQERIDYLKKLLALFTGITWIKHKKYIEDLIDRTKSEMEKTEIDEIIYGI